MAENREDKTTAEMTGTPETIDTEETTSTPEAPDTDETVKKPETIDTEETTSTPEAPDTEETVKTPEAPDTEETAETPEAPDSADRTDPLDGIAKRVIVSLTSYPARIGYVPEVLETIFAQTRPADEIVLWLADSEFPGKEEDLPEDLRTMTGDGRVTLKWCPDLKPHKKYFYAFQEYPQDLIVTIDDDAYYAPDLLEKLVTSYVRWPHAVSAGRVHLMAITEDGGLLPYQMWVKDTDACVSEPSMQLFATGVGGVLYPAELFADSVLLNEEAVRETCLYADDIWLKAMELVADVPVVPAHEYRAPQNVPGSQESSLYYQNADQGENDVCIGKVSDWLDLHVKEGIFREKILASADGIRQIGIEALCRHMASERANSRSRYAALNQKLNEVYRRKDEITEQLREQRENLAKRLEYSEGKREELREKNARLEERLAKSNAQRAELNAQKAKLNEQKAKLNEQRAELNKKLQKTYDEKAERGQRIKELEQQVYNLQHPLKHAAKKVTGKDKKDKEE